MGKMKICIYWYFIADILTKVFLQIFDEWSSTKQILFVQTSQFDWLSWQPKGWICEKYSKLNSVAIWEIKLKLCRNVHSISFYKSIVFIAVTYALWLLWVFSFHRLIMGKMKIGFNCCLFANILTKHFWSRLLSSSPPSVKILCKLLILICCHCHWKAKMLN